MVRRFEQICQLRESLNVTNDKHSRLLREDLEKNYRIIELEGKIEDLEAENERLKLNYEELMGTVETLRRDAFLDSDANSCLKMQIPYSKKLVFSKKSSNF